MPSFRWLAVLTALATALIVVSTGSAADWDTKLRAALAELEQGVTAPRLEQALNAAYHADDWQAGLETAARLNELTDAPVALRGRVLRALWRGGKLVEAAKLADTFPEDIKDRETLSVLGSLRIAQGRWDEGDRHLAALDRLGPETAFQAYTIVTNRLQRGQTRNMVKLMEDAAKLIDEDRGYPDAFLKDASVGLVDLARGIGDQPVNIVSEFGTADMPALAGVGLPSVEVFLNGKGPYRLMLDTGGSVTLSLDKETAEEVGLPKMAMSKIHGIGGVQDAFQTIIDDVQIDDIRMRRVMCHAFEMPKVLSGVHGIMGTGLFLNDRFTLDFAAGKLEVQGSGGLPAEGTDFPLWIIADAKLLAWVDLNGRKGAALIDSGADSSLISPDFVRMAFPERNLMGFPLPTAAGVGEGQEGSIMFVPAMDLTMADHQPTGFGGLALSTLDEMLSPIIGVHCNALVGMNILRQMRSLTIDGPQSKGWIHWIE